MKKLIRAFKELPAFLGEWKKQLITTAIVAVSCFLVMGIAGFAGNIFHAMHTESDAALASLDNEIDTFRKSDRYFTGQDELLTDESNVEVRYVGTRIDAGRWRTDEQCFWDFISPAFNYDSATEYNQMRAAYETKLGKCLFTTQFLTPYDIDQAAMNARTEDQKKAGGEITEIERDKADHAFTCMSDKGHMVTYPIGRDSNGNYGYVSFVGFGRSSRSKENPTMIAFTYTVVHTKTSETEESMSITNFACWPQQGRDPVTWTNFGRQ